MMINDFSFEIKREDVVRLIDCREDSPVYDAVMESYEEILNALLQIIKPAVIMNFGIIDDSTTCAQLPSGTKVFYIIATLGRDASKTCTELFKNEDYLGGMLADAIANYYLLMMESSVKEIAKEECRRINMGIAERLEAPKDIPMSFQRIIHDSTDSARLLGINITEGNMFDPVKTIGFILKLSEDVSLCNINHNCSNCDAIECKFRSVPPANITVISGNREFMMSCNAGESLLEALIRNKYCHNATCGRMGTCGKCRIRVIKGNLDVSQADRDKINFDDIQNGYRLACKSYPEKDCTIELDSGFNSDFTIVADYNKNRDEMCFKTDNGYAIVIDIGTTTIASQLVAMKSGEAIRTYTSLNSQRIYGADVISRIRASNQDKSELLKKSIVSDLKKCIMEILSAEGISLHELLKIVISGNTTMIHLLMGYSCISLGVSPFTPVNIDRIEVLASDILGINSECQVIIMPGISTYVGGDIVSGLFCCDFDTLKKPSLFIDLGTNGEIALGCRDGILCTSTAAGPAFEGGNIICGTGSVAGAICGVQLIGDDVKFATIGYLPPTGICGSGIIDIAAELLKEKIIDGSGLMEEKFFDKGFALFKGPKDREILITQKDIREIQLAKSAIRSGADILIKRYGINYNDIDAVFFAGGFGYSVNLHNAAYIGLIPGEFIEKTVIAGNTSLGGVLKYLTAENSLSRIEKIITISREVNLSGENDFNELFMENITF
ncbi:MAG: ASKHA domain-containing protein [Smithella sp.]